MFDPDEGELVANRRLADPTVPPGFTPNVEHRRVAAPGSQNTLAHDAAQPSVPAPSSPPSPGFAPPAPAPQPTGVPRRKNRLLTGLIAAGAAASLTLMGTGWWLNSREGGAGSGISTPAGPAQTSTQSDESPASEQERTDQATVEPAVEGVWSPPIFAPDVVEQPTRSTQLDSREVLDGEFMVTLFADPLDPETGLALGYTPVQSENQAGRGAAAMAAFDLTTGERRWQVDLLAAAGLSGDDELGPVGAILDGAGLVLVYLAVEPEGFAYAAIDSQGQVVSTTQGGRGLLEAKGGVALAIEVPDVFAQSLTDLGTEIWRADYVGLGNYADPLIGEFSGTFWAATADGFVDAGSGQALGFGADAGDSDTFYALAAASDEPIPLRVRSTAGRITRVDPTSASDLWTVDLGQEAATALAFTAEMVFAQPSDGSSAVGVRAIDLVDGTVVWEADAGRIVGNSAGYWSTFASDVVLAHRTGRKGDLVALDTVNGQELFGIACADDCEFGAQSREVIYLSEGWPDGSGRIRAVSLVDGSELWTAEVELPQIYDWTPKVEFTATHLWLKSAGQVGVGTHEVMQRIV